METKRTLTDSDVQAIAERIEQSITERFQLNVGKGVLRIAWRMFMHGLIILAAYGAGAGAFKKFF
jgi:hypothetical protein